MLQRADYQPSYFRLDAPQRGCGEKKSNLRIGSTGKSATHCSFARPFAGSATYEVMLMFTDGPPNSPGPGSGPKNSPPSSNRSIARMRLRAACDLRTYPWALAWRTSVESLSDSCMVNIKMRGRGSRFAM